jgi:hypothetical protein
VLSSATERVGPPARQPWIQDDQVVTDENGKVKYSRIIDFTHPRIRGAWSDAVVKVVRNAYPDLFIAEVA